MLQVPGGGILPGWGMGVSNGDQHDESSRWSKHYSKKYQKKNWLVWGRRGGRNSWFSFECSGAGEA